jgi:hypothetical protein
VDIVGGDQGKAGPFGDLKQAFVGFALVRQAMVLQLDKEVFWPQDFPVAFGARDRLVELAA